MADSTTPAATDHLVSSVRIWIMAARLRTLPAAVAPVLVGTALSATERDLRVGGFVAALLGAIFIQVGTNLSNDYSDARRGADAEDRLGPVRVTAGGLVPPRQVLVATYVSFGLAVLCGVYLVWLAGPILLAIGAASILAGVLYTGGPRPYGYEGLGEVFVFLFFGIVAVTGSYYVQAEQVTWEAFVLAVPVGLLASADPRRQQRPRPRVRPARRQAHAGRTTRARARAYPVRTHGLRRLPDRAGALGGGVAVGMAAPAPGAPAGGRLARAHRPPPRRRTDPQPRAGAHRDAPARVLRAAVGGAAVELMDVRVATVTLTFADPMRTAFGVLRKRELLLLRLRDADGAVGWGEAAALEAYDGVSQAKVRDAFEAYEAILRDGDGNPAADLLERCRIVADVPQALAAVDLALWDLAGNREGKPISELISDDPATEVRVNATIPAQDRAHAAEQAAAAASAGYSCVKVKVGIGDDAGRVAAVRAAAGSQMELRLDANGAWEVDEAVASINALAPAGLELVEEPVHGVHAMRQVRDRVAVRVAMDETAGQPGSLTAKVADAVCLKVSRCGGISRLLAQAALVRASGADVYLASTFDGPLGIAAAVHCAAALKTTAACGLGTLELFADELTVLPVEDGAIAVPAQPGLGV